MSFSLRYVGFTILNQCRFHIILFNIYGLDGVKIAGRNGTTVLDGFCDLPAAVAKLLAAWGLSRNEQARNQPVGLVGVFLSLSNIDYYYIGGLQPFQITNAVCTHV